MGKKVVKKLFTAVLVVAMAFGCLVAVSGCNLIVENDNRVANQVLATVEGYGGIKMTVTQNELMDYFNTYASYLTSPDYGYNYTVEEAFDWCLENKIKSKYLVTAAMVYLTDIQSGNASVVARNAIDVRYNIGALVKPEDSLTYAEYLATVYSTNDTIQQSLDSLIKKGHQDNLQTIVNDIEKTNVDYIEFSDDTKNYLKSEYFVNQGIDNNSIKIHIVYTDGEKSDDFVVPDGMYVTKFDSSAEKTDNKIEISIDEKIIDDNGTTTYKPHTLTHTYNVVSPRATRTQEEQVDDNYVEIGEIKVLRYATKAQVDAQLKEAGIDAQKIDPQAEYNRLKVLPAADKDLVDAYRQLNENLSRSNKDMAYYYASAFESAVLSALQHEVKKAAAQENPITDAQIVNEFKFLYQTGKSSYDNVDDPIKTFGSSITKGIDALYYYPTVTKLDEYFFVYQLLLKFSDEQSAFLKTQTGADKELTQRLYEYAKTDIEVKESNPNYDPDFDCPYHEKGIHTEDCIYEGEGTCPSSAYVLDENGDIVTAKFDEVYTALQTELATIYAKTITEDYTADAQSSEALEKFIEFVYKYNDDPGIMNSSAGYAIGPKGEPDPNAGFDKDFLELCHDVFKHGSEVGNAFTDDGKLGYKMTSFGAHIVIVSMTPFSSGVGLDNLLADNDAMQAYLDRAINIDGDTLRNTIAENLLKDLKTRAYNNFTDSKVKADLIDDKDIVSIETKKIDKMLKDYTGR